MNTRTQADRVRNIPLESVLRLSGAVRDQFDKAKWHTSVGVLSVNGAKFMNWKVGHGGGGAIDLVMHLHDLSFRQAVQWLNDSFRGCVPSAYEPHPESDRPSPTPSLAIPPPQPAKLQRVRQYLLGERGLPQELVDPLIRAGTLYADCHANAVFLLLGKQRRPVGAELRGTARQWRAMARGSRKDAGFFYAPADPPGTGSPIVLVESAIDAISCLALHTKHLCVSTAGVRSNPSWLPALLDRGYQVFCGFDADEPGDTAARGMMELYPAIQRLRPSLKDWNDVLRPAA